MMHLSRLRLSPRSAEARRDLADPYRLHQTLVAVLGGKRGDHEGLNAERSTGHGLLFRSEPEAKGGPAVLVQTLVLPDWGRLPAGYARVEGPTELAPKLEGRQRLRFRLVANPTVKKKIEGRKHGTRVPLVHPRAPAAHPEVTSGYLDWLERKMTAAGLDVNLDRTTDASFQVRTGKADGTGGRHRVTLFGVRFDGLVTVHDPDAARGALRGGIGPAKGFGFGLLSLARA